MERGEICRRDCLHQQCDASSLIFAVYLSHQGSRMTRKKMGAYKMVVSQNDQLTRIHIPCKFHGRPGLIVLYEATPPYPRASQLLPSMQSVQAYMHESRPSPASSESKRPGLDDLRKSGLKKRRVSFLFSSPG